MPLPVATYKLPSRMDSPAGAQMPAWRWLSVVKLTSGPEPETGAPITRPL